MREPAISTPRLIRFGVYEADLQAGELRKKGVKLRLEGQPLRILALLLERPGQLVTREELKQKLWPTDTFVDFEHSINAAVLRLRQALDDSAGTPRFIETLPRHGYRFISAVEDGAAEARRPTAWWRRHRAASLLLAGVSAVLVGLLAANVAGLRDRLLGRPVAGEITSIAVLPLENLSGDPEQDYFADGMTEALIAELGKISALRVISRQSVMQFKGTDKSLPEIARELNVDAIVEGAVVREGNRVRITAQLVHASPERHIWSETYERDLHSILALQGEVARKIAEKIRIGVTPQEEVRLARARTVNPEAYEAFLKGRYHWNKRTEADLDKALAYFQQVTNADPTYAPAYVALAETYLLLAGYGYGHALTLEAIPKARAAALKALEIDENLGEAYIPLAQAKWRFAWDWLGEEEFHQGLALNPNYATGHHWYGGYLTAMGRYEDGIEELKRAVALDPLSLIINADLGGEGYYFARQYEQAVKQFHKVIQLDPNFYVAHVYLCDSYVEMGKHPDALAECEKGAELSGRSSYALRSLGYAYAVAGRKEAAWAVIKELEERAKNAYVPPYNFSVIYAGLGLKEEALAWLDKAFAEHSEGMQWIKTDPRLDALRADSRFQSLLRRMNFPD